MLELQNKSDNILSKYDMMYLMPNLKKQTDYLWLNEVSAASLNNVCWNLGKAFKMYFEHKTKHPKFKSKKTCKNSYPVCENRLKFYDNTVQVQKIGRIKIKDKYIQSNKICSPYISYINNKWILSFQIKCENQTFNNLTDKSMGIDLGIKELAVVAFDNQKIIYHNINKIKRMKNISHKIKHIQRVLNRKYRKNPNGNTKNIEKYEKILKQLYNKQRNIRLNYIHQITHSLINLYPQRIVMEDLAILNMMKNKRLAKSINEQCFSEFIRQMKYKCEWNGIEFIQANKFYPSSKTCSCCGNTKKDLRLSDRIYVCDNCGLIIDRDYNAAVNLMNYKEYINHRKDL